jgi:trehalose/maltose transport system substrate-binding protein
MKHKVLWLSRLVLGLTLVLLAGCSGATPVENEVTEAPATEPAESGEVEASSAGEITLTVQVRLFPELEAILQPIVEQFETETGARVVFVDPDSGSDIDKLTRIRQMLEAGSSQVDIYEIDIIWSGILAEHALDLSAHIPSAELDAHISAIIDNHTVDDKQVALPFYADAGLLYYRADLLEQYGYDEPPATWDELEEMAAVIQAGERAAGNDEFWGFVWQGASNEGLTCDALEWQASHDGGHIIEPDGTISVNNPGAIAAFERAAGWVGVISPPDVVDYDGALTRKVMDNGNAAFMRQWPMFWSNEIHDAVIEGRYGVTVLPTAGARHAATLGGWGLMVSRYSEHPELAASFLALMRSPEVQKQHALLGDLMGIEALYHDPDVLATRPYMADMLPVLQNAVPRPSTVTGAQYAEVSAAYYNNVHRILTGEVSAAEGVADLEAELIDITGFEAPRP